MNFKKQFEILIKKIVNEIKNYYDSRLVSVVLFGSQARGTQRPDSDIDLLVIVSDLPKSRLERSEEFSRIEDRLEEDLERLYFKGICTWISPVLKTPEEVERGSLLMLDMVEDAKILYDKNNFFKNRMKRLKERLKQLGAKRIWQGNAWYWVLKPDLRPGERIEL